MKVTFVPAWFFFFATLFPAFAQEIKPRKTTYEQIRRVDLGYKGFYEVPMTFGGDGTFRAGIGITTVQGFQLTRNLFLGAGAGIAGYDKPSYDSTLLNAMLSDDDYEYVPPEERFVFAPCFGDVRWYFNSRRDEEKFLSLQAGWSPFIKAKFKDDQKHLFPYEYSGGLYLSPRIGWNLIMHEKSGVSCTVGYRFQGYTIKGERRAVHSAVLSLGFVLAP